MTELQACARLPVLATVELVCRECLPSYDIEALSHVVDLLDKYLDTFSSRWEVAKACSFGLSRRALEYLAARDPDWGNGESAAEHAVSKGYVHVLQWLNECYPERTRWGLTVVTERLWAGVCLMTVAIKSGQLPILQWLHANRSEECTARAIDKAACIGRLDMIQWLHENSSEGCTTNALANVALHGHLDVLKWLHSHYGEKCTKEAMNLAAGCGQLDVVKWLHTNCDEGCSKRAMDLAAAYGRLEIVRFLHENRLLKRFFVPKTAANILSVGSSSTSSHNEE